MRKQIAFASLTDSEIQEIADSLDGATYDAVLTRICKPRSEGGYGLNISRSPLERLWAKKRKITKINEHIASGEKLTIATLDAIEAGDAPASEDVHDAILTATYKEAISGENTPHQLLALQRLADFPERAELRAQRAEIDLAREHRAQAREERAKEMHAHKIAMDLRKQTHKEKRDDFYQHIDARKTVVLEKTIALREQESARAFDSKLKTKNSQFESQSDELGPYATNLDDVSERLRIQFGVSKEEWARRTSVENDPYLTNDAPQDDSEIHSGVSSEPAPISEIPNSKFIIPDSAAAAAAAATGFP